MVPKVVFNNRGKGLIQFFLCQTNLTISFGHYRFDCLEPLVWELLGIFDHFSWSSVGLSFGQQKV